MQGKTNAWDLASLVVKPVQRVLKYPLFIKRLTETTESTHTDYIHVKEADRAIGLVAEKINEVKKRVDIVEQYVEGKPVNVMRGITKKWTRGTQKVLMS